MTRRKIALWVILFMIIGIVFIIYLGQKSQKLEPELELCMQKVNNITYMALQTLYSVEQLKDEDISELQRIIINKIKSGQYLVEGTYETNLEAIFHVKLGEQRFIIGYNPDEQMLFFNFPWLMPQIPDEVSGEDIYNLKIKKIYIKGGNEFNSLLERYM